jgi:hypothetical protein
MKVFQYPNTGTTMDDRDIQVDDLKSGVAKLYKFFADGRVIEKIVLSSHFSGRGPCGPLKGIIFSEIMGSKDLVNGLTTLTAKILTIKDKGRNVTIVTAMITAGHIQSHLLHTCSKDVLGSILKT